jgi:hypothetical protein
MLAGEGHAAVLEAFVAEALAYYRERGDLIATPLPLLSARDAHGATEASAPAAAAATASLLGLRFPGKVAVDVEGDRLFIADTGRHRVVVARRDGSVLTIYGQTDVPGADDDDDADLANEQGDHVTSTTPTPTKATTTRRQARVQAPRGLAYAAGPPARLYVADTGNHTVRVIDLERSTVTTVAGTGAQGHDRVGGGKGRAQALCSPWDLVLLPAPAPAAVPTRLLIAMAGNHQLWSLDLATGEARRWAGSGAEANRNSSDPALTAFAQPSGLAVGREGAVYIADSESSAVRLVGTAGKYYARAICGGDRADPGNLFAFGDQDGRGDRARLQHPLAVAFVPGALWQPVPALGALPEAMAAPVPAPADDGDVLVVADTYNHSLKVVRAPIAHGETALWAGVREGAGSALADGPAATSTFAEPSGLAVDAGLRCVWVADTNHHAIRRVRLPDGHVDTLPLHWPAAAAAADAPPADERVRPPSHLGCLATSLSSVCVLVELGGIAGRGGRQANDAGGAGGTSACLWHGGRDLAAAARAPHHSRRTLALPARAGRCPCPHPLGRPQHRHAPARGRRWRRERQPCDLADAVGGGGRRGRRGRPGGGAAGGGPGALLLQRRGRPLHGRDCDAHPRARPQSLARGHHHRSQRHLGLCRVKRLSHTHAHTHTDTPTAQAKVAHHLRTCAVCGPRMGDDDEETWVAVPSPPPLPQPELVPAAAAAAAAHEEDDDDANVAWMEVPVPGLCTGAPYHTAPLTPPVALSLSLSLSLSVCVCACRASSPQEATGGGEHTRGRAGARDCDQCACRGRLGWCRSQYCACPPRPG